MLFQKKTSVAIEAITPTPEVTGFFVVHLPALTPQSEVSEMLAAWSSRFPHGPKLITVLAPARLEAYRVEEVKVCRIYYAEVVYTGLATLTDTRRIEPFVSDGVTFGKQLEACCPEMARRLPKGTDEYSTRNDGFRLNADLTLKLSGFNEPLVLEHCPFCGAKIEFVKDLDVRATVRKVPQVYENTVVTYDVVSA